MQKAGSPVLAAVICLLTQRSHAHTHPYNSATQPTLNLSLLPATVMLSAARRTASAPATESSHTVGVTESSLQEIRGSKRFSLDNLSWNFTEGIMNANKVIHEIWLLFVNLEKITSINQKSDQSQPSKRSTVIGRS